MAESSRAVFLSYASQDSDAAQRIGTALRAAGIEVWLDQSELRGGDAWDHKIRREIQECALFVPIISAHTQERLEGYFRLEWDLADQRTHRMARARTFIVPVCVDSTPEAHAEVPESFQRVQWMRLPGGATPPAFVERVQRLLTPELPPAPSTARPLGGPPPGNVTHTVRAPARRGWLPVAAVAAVLVVALLGYLLKDRLSGSHSAPSSPAASSSVPANSAAPPPHSIAVLPFANLSGDPAQEYFSDGLTEELLNSLAEIEGLKVAARTSSFYFKGKDVDLGTIAQKLNVGAVLEGSVRRSSHTIRITAQLIDAVKGYHLWSKTYDRDTGDVLKLQSEIATAVAGALKVTLLGNEAQKIEVGGTHNPGAFDAYLKAFKLYSTAHDATGWQSAIGAFTEAIRQDPTYALAYAGRSMAYGGYGAEYATAGAVADALQKARADAQQSLKLAPDLADGHLAMARLHESLIEYGPAQEEFERAVALAPGNVRAPAVEAGRFAVWMGRFDSGISQTQRAVALDPLNPRSHFLLGTAFFYARRYEPAIAAFSDAITLNPDASDSYGYRGFAYYAAGDLQHAREGCESKRESYWDQMCLALVYHKLGRHSDAQAELKKLQDAIGDAAAYQYASIYAQWGDTAQSLRWLETALRVRDSGLELLKTDPLIDPIRAEPRFQAVLRELKFPD